MTSKENNKSNKNSSRYGRRHESREPNIPKEIREQGLSAIGEWITYNRLRKSDLIAIIMDLKSKKKRQDDTDTESDSDDDEYEKRRRKKKRRKKSKQDGNEVTDRLNTLEKAVNKIADALKGNEQREEESESDSDDEIDLLEAPTETQKLNVNSVKKMFKKLKVTVPASKEIKKIISTIETHEYNYMGNDKTKIKTIGTKLFELKKQYKIQYNVTKKSLTSTTEKWIHVAILALKTIIDSRRM